MGMELSDEALVEVFKALDTEDKGYITVDQFTNTFSEYYANSGRRDSSTPTDIKQIVTALDPTQDGIIHLNAFKNVFMKEISGSDDVKEGTHRASSEFSAEDSGVHLPELSAIDPDEVSLLSADGAQPHIFRQTGIRSSWPKREASNTLYAINPGRNGMESPASASRSDILMDDVETNFEQIRDQMRQMEARVETLQSSQQNEATSRSTRLREENNRLTVQITVLEERLKEAEARALRDLETERQHLQSMMARTTRDHNADIETLRSRIAALESECGDLRMERSVLKAEGQSNTLELRRTAEALNEAQEKIFIFESELKEKEEKFDLDMDTLKKDRDHAVRVLEELNGSITGGKRRSLTISQLSTSGVMEVAGGSEVLARYNEVQEIVRRLTKENKALRQQLEEAQEELLARSLEEGHSLLKSSEKSWAAELDTCTKEEVVQLLSTEKFANAQLREYINSLITRIIERHPSLLEVAG